MVRKGSAALGTLSEHQEQKLLIGWVDVAALELPVLDLLYAIPNGGHRHISVAKKLKDEGVKRGIPDLFLPVAKGGSHGLYIEMKTTKGKLKSEQKEWRDKLVEQGYAWALCRGHIEAMFTLEEYMDVQIKGWDQCLRSS